MIHLLASLNMEGILISPYQKTLQTTQVRKLWWHAVLYLRGSPVPESPEEEGRQERENAIKPMCKIRELSGNGCADAQAVSWQLSYYCKEQPVKLASGFLRLKCCGRKGKLQQKGAESGRTQRLRLGL